MKTTAYILTLASCLCGCTTHQPSAKRFDPQPNSFTFIGNSNSHGWMNPHRATRAEVVTLLTTEGIIAPDTQVRFAVHNRKSGTWHVILRHANGVRSEWDVDGNLEEWSGGTSVSKANRHA